MNSVIEPTLESVPSPLLRYVLATRPPFLSVTLMGCLVGIACAVHAGAHVDALTAIATCVFALVAHAGVNVLNDYFDARNGTDAANTERVYPFTGGSRFIQNGLLTEAQTRRFGYWLMALVVPAGLWLASRSQPGLLYVGLVGLVVGWAYSAPPVHLVSRGLGELAITTNWALVVVGAAMVQHAGLSRAIVLVGLSYGLLVANVLFINQFPDAAADGSVGKRTLVVRLGVGPARAVYPLIVVTSALLLASGMATQALPPTVLYAFLPYLVSVAAARALWVSGGKPSGLKGAIPLTIVAALAQGLALTIVLWTSGP